MKFVFLQSGDSIEFKSNPAKVVEHWFEYMFDQQANSSICSSGSDSPNIQRLIARLNSSISKMNLLLKERIPSNNIFFEYCTTLDQPRLNETHKQWAMLTAKYSNQINPDDYPFPREWHDINHLIHQIEGRYSSYFYNKKIISLPDQFVTNIQPEDYTYHKQGLMLSYCNLGRHQYNQWSAGTIPDEETNNFKVISYNFEYQCYLQPAVDLPPPEYVDWCKTHKLNVVPPEISLGDFVNYDRHEIKKIFYRNLLVSNDMGFEK